MKKTFVALVLLIAATTALSQQGSVRIQTTPALPSREMLERLSMTMAWSNRVTVNGQHDGFYTLQLFPGPEFTLLVAQTYKGSVVAINADTGDILWRTPVGLPYRSILPVGVNDQAIFACRNFTLYALDRDTGKQLFYTVGPNTGVREYGQALGDAMTAGPAVAEDYVFLCFGERLVRFVVPNFRAVAKAKVLAPVPGGTPEGSPPPAIRTWDYSTLGYVTQRPILASGLVVATADNGNVVSLKKFNPGDDDMPIWHGQFRTGGAIVGTVASHRSMIYIPSQDDFLYALDVVTNRLAWRFAGQSPIIASPQVTDADVFIRVRKNGFYRLERTTGNVKWSNPDAVKFLSTNQKFVYALDRQNKMLLMDYERGKTLAAWDSRDWILSIPNDHTDRVYLASNDGQIICLRHRDFVQPLKLRTTEAVRPKGKVAAEKGKDIIPLPEDKTPPVEDKLPKDKDVKDDKDKKEDKELKDDKDKKDKNVRELAGAATPQATWRLVSRWTIDEDRLMLCVSDRRHNPLFRICRQSLPLVGASAG